MGSVSQVLLFLAALIFKTGRSQEDGSCKRPVILLAGPSEWARYSSEDAAATERRQGGARPLRYQLEFSFPPQGGRYDVDVQIVLQVMEKTAAIQLDADLGKLELRPASVRLSRVGGRPICVTTLFYDLANMTLLLQPAEELEEGQYSVGLRAGRSLDGEAPVGGLLNATGFAGGRWLLHTESQFRFARQIFPCFDQPALKATFQTCISCPSDWSAFSNTPIDSFSVGWDGISRSCFKETPRMPSYLLAVALAKGMSVFSAPAEPGLPLSLRLVFPPDQLDRSIADDFAFAKRVTDSAGAAIRFMQEFTGRPFPLEKYDELAIKPFFAGGLENFGIASLDWETLQANFTYIVDTVVVHEAIHSWIGDTITVASWNETVLQEGLTTFLQALSTGQRAVDGYSFNAIMKELKLLNTLMTLFQEDVGGSAPVGPVLIENDTFSTELQFRMYNQGPLIFNLMEVGFGEGTVRGVTRILLHRFPFDSFTLKDMASAFVETTTDAKAADVFNAWMTKKGWPILYLTMSREGTLRVTQYRQEGQKIFPVMGDEAWPIPYAEGQFIEEPSWEPNPGQDTSAIIAQLFESASALPFKVLPSPDMLRDSEALKAVYSDLFMGQVLDYTVMWAVRVGFPLGDSELTWEDYVQFAVSGQEPLAMGRGILSVAVRCLQTADTCDEVMTRLNLTRSSSLRRLAAALPPVSRQTIQSILGPVEFAAASEGQGTGSVGFGGREGGAGGDGGSGAGGGGSGGRDSSQPPCNCAQSGGSTDGGGTEPLSGPQSDGAPESVDLNGDGFQITASVLDQLTSLVRAAVDAFASGASDAGQAVPDDGASPPQ